MTSFGAFGEPGRPDDDYAFPEDEPSTTVTDPLVQAAELGAKRASQALASLEKLETEDEGWELLPSVRRATLGRDG